MAHNKTSTDTEKDKVRLDKWLWAARFFKTRGLAKQAIDGGKVHYNGERSKPSRYVDLGATLKIRQGWSEKEVIVKDLADQRRGAPEAAKLYEETQQSIESRETEAEQRRMLKTTLLSPDHKPSKKERRQISRFKQLYNSLSDED